MNIQTATQFHNFDAGNDYLEYFFLRMKSAGGMVMSVNGTATVASPMLPDNRGSQLFKFQAISTTSPFAQIINQATQMAMSVDYNGVIWFAPPDPTALNQQWSLDATNQLVAGSSGRVISLNGASFTLNGLPNPQAVPQQFELFYPSDFVYVRNCWTGRLLTADSAGNVSWKIWDTTTFNQQWGVTSDGFLVNRANAQVLQLAGSQPLDQMPLNTGPQVAVGAGDTYQRFNVNAPDGAFHSLAGDSFVISTNNNDLAFVTPYSATDYHQLIEFISIFQFFSLECGCFNGSSQPWLERSGNSAILDPAQTGKPEQFFTVSRFGELISPLDGFVLQSGGSGAGVQFVDPKPDPIGFDTTTFVYNQVASGQANYGAITLRSDNTLGLICYGGRPPSPQMYSPLWVPVSGNQCWQMVGAQQSLFASYQGLAMAYFSDPAPLPGAPPQIEAANPELDRLIGQIDKAPLVIITLIAGILDIAAGISVGSVGDTVVTAVAKLVLGNADTAAKVAVIMQGTVTAASIIAVADGITKAGLWWKIFKLLLPSSFWGWALTIAKLGLTIAAWALGAGPAITGAKIALLCADILRILSGNMAGAMHEAALISDHVVKQIAAGRATVRQAA